MEAFLHNFEKNGKVLCYSLKKKLKLFVSFLGSIDKYIKILCYFWELYQVFGFILEASWGILTNFQNSTKILCCFLCHFLKTPKFGRSPKIWEPAIAPIKKVYDVWIHPNQIFIDPWSISRRVQVSLL